MRIFDIDWRGSPEFVDLFFQFNIRQLISKGIYENLFTEKEKTKIFLIIKKIVDNIESEHKQKDFGDILHHIENYLTQQQDRTTKKLLVLNQAIHGMVRGRKGAECTELEGSSDKPIQELKMMLIRVLRTHPFFNGNLYSFTISGIMPKILPLKSGSLVVNQFGIYFYDQGHFLQPVYFVSLFNLTNLKSFKKEIIIEFMTSVDSTNKEQLHLKTPLALQIAEDIVSYSLLNLRMNRSLHYLYKYLTDNASSPGSALQLDFLYLSSLEDIKLSGYYKGQEDQALRCLQSVAAYNRSQSTDPSQLANPSEEDSQRLKEFTPFNSSNRLHRTVRDIRLPDGVSEGH